MTILRIGAIDFHQDIASFEICDWPSIDPRRVRNRVIEYLHMWIAGGHIRNTIKDVLSHNVVGMRIEGMGTSRHLEWNNARCTVSFVKVNRIQGRGVPGEDPSRLDPSQVHGYLWEWREVGLSEAQRQILLHKRQPTLWWLGLSWKLRRVESCPVISSTNFSRVTCTSRTNRGKASKPARSHRGASKVNVKNKHGNSVAGSKY